MASNPVCIVGGTGALGFGLALRLAREGVPVVIGSRRAERAAEAVGRVRAAVPDGRFEGLRPVDCGPLEMARIIEQLTPLIISINVRHKVRAGIKITGL